MTKECRTSANVITPVPQRRIWRRPILSEIGPEMIAKIPTMRAYADTSVPSTASPIWSSSPIRGRIGEMIMIWLADEKTSSQRAKTMTPGDVLSLTRRPSRVVPVDEHRVSLVGRQQHEVEHVDVCRGVHDIRDGVGDVVGPEWLVALV